MYDKLYAVTKCIKIFSYSAKKNDPPQHQIVAPLRLSGHIFTLDTGEQESNEISGY